MQKSLKQYRKNDITLNSDHHREMCQLTSTIHSNYLDNLEQLFTEAEAANPQQSQLLRKVWEEDVKSRVEFLEDQKKNSKSTDTLHTFI